MKRQKIKKWAVLFLALTLILGAIPATASAADPITVYVTVSNAGDLALDKDNKIVAQAPVTVTAANPTLNDALIALHRTYFSGGAAGYATSTGQWGLQVDKLWGVTTNATGYYKNNDSAAGVGSETISDGDCITAYIYSDTTYWSDQYAHFDKGVVRAITGTDFALTLSGVTWNGSGPLAHAQLVTVDSAGGKTDIVGAVTDAAGNATLRFTATGEYTVSATTTAAITAPVSKVYVYAVEDDSVRSLVVGDDKAALKLPASATADLALPAIGASGATDITWQTSNVNAISAGGAVTRGLVDTTVTLTANIAHKNNSSISSVKTFVVTVPAAANSNYNTLMENIAATYTENSGERVVMDMAAYKEYNSATTSVTSATARQAYINYAAKVINDYTQSASGDFAASDAEYAKAIISLQSIGVNPRQLYPVNSNTPMDAVAKLKTTITSSIYNVQDVLNAYQQGNYSSDSQEQAVIDFALAQQDAATKAWGYDYGGFVPDLDGTAMVIAGLAPYYNSDTAVKNAVNEAIGWLSSQQETSGVFKSWGTESAETAAVVIVALAAVGVDPDTDARFIKNGTSLLDGFLAFATTDGFKHVDTDTGNNAGATEQGFRALIAAAQVMSTGQAYNIYDFSGNTVVAGRATGTGSVTTPSEPVSSTDITVTFALNGRNNDAWLSSRSVTVKADAKVYHVFKKVLDESSYTYSGAANGYVTSVTNPAGTTLAEGDYGANSGWLYKVNGQLPSVGLTEHSLSDGDRILWYYTDDWTKDPSAKKYAPDSAEIPTEGVVAPEAGSTIDDMQDVSPEDWFYEAVKFVMEQGLFKGVAEDRFDPEGTMTRGMFVTVLGRLAGVDESQYRDGAFSDVAAGAWYAAFAQWAAETEVAAGYPDGSFGPGDEISREQMVTMLYRLAQAMGLDPVVEEPVDLSGFGDGGQIAPWALDAFSWAVSVGLIEGTDKGLLNPGNTATRAEAAAMLQRAAALFGA